MLLSIKDKFKRLVFRELGFIPDIGKRTRVEADIHIFNKKEDEYIWNQTKGMDPLYFNVYFDDAHVIGFSENDEPVSTMVEFGKKLKELHNAGTITLDKDQAKEKQMIKEQAEKAERIRKKEAVDKLPESTKEQKMAKEVVKRVNRRVSAK